MSNDAQQRDAMCIKPIGAVCGLGVFYDSGLQWEKCAHLIWHAMTPDVLTVQYEPGTSLGHAGGQWHFSACRRQFRNAVLCRHSDAGDASSNTFGDSTNTIGSLSRSGLTGEMRWLLPHPWLVFRFKMGALHIGRGFPNGIVLSSGYLACEAPVRATWLQRQIRLVPYKRLGYPAYKGYCAMDWRFLLLAKQCYAGTVQAVWRMTALAAVMNF